MYVKCISWLCVRYPCTSTNTMFRVLLYGFLFVVRGSVLHLISDCFLYTSIEGFLFATTEFNCYTWIIYKIMQGIIFSIFYLFVCVCYAHHGTHLRVCQIRLGGKCLYLEDHLPGPRVQLSHIVLMVKPGCHSTGLPSLRRLVGQTSRMCVRMSEWTNQRRKALPEFRLCHPVCWESRQDKSGDEGKRRELASVGFAHLALQLS